MSTSKVASSDEKCWNIFYTSRSNHKNRSHQRTHDGRCNSIHKCFYGCVFCNFFKVGSGNNGEQITGKKSGKTGYCSHRGNQPIRYPINPTVITTGPGVIMATATASINCVSVSQWFSITTPPCRKGTIARPLPKTKAPAFKKNNPILLRYLRFIIPKSRIPKIKKWT